MVEEVIASRPWIAGMGTLTGQMDKFFEKRQNLAKMLAEMEGRAQPYESLIELFGGEQEVLFAVML